MPQYDFRSPGAAVGNAIQQLLMQREAENRQRMLDEIALRREDREDEIKRGQLEVNRAQMEALNEQRAAQTSAREQQQALTRASAYDIGDVVGQEDVDAIRRSVDRFLAFCTCKRPFRGAPSTCPPTPWGVVVPRCVALRCRLSRPAR